MVTVQIILLTLLIGLTLFLLASRVKAEVQAGMKLGFLLFGILATYAVLRPSDLTTLANAVGVGRGTDLLLYTLVVAYSITVTAVYVRFRHHELRFARLVRAFTLAEAERRIQPDLDTKATDSSAPETLW